jgi:hypothetical protein
MNYDAYRHNKIETGLVYQDFICDLLLRTLGLPVVQYASKFYQQQVGESRTGVEIKHDERYARSGNLWIEVAEKAVPRPGPYAPSGIYRSDNTWLYVIGNYDVVFLFGKTTLQNLVASKRFPLLENGLKTSEGFLLPDAWARRCALAILTPAAEQKVTSAIRDLHQLGRALQRIVMGEPVERTLFDLLDEETVETPIR